VVLPYLQAKEESVISYIADKDDDIFDSEDEDPDEDLDL
jgi:hypothetical protein